MVALMGGVHVHDRWLVVVEKSLADGNHAAGKGERLDTTKAAHVLSIPWGPNIITHHTPT